MQMKESVEAKAYQAQKETMIARILKTAETDEFCVYPRDEDGNEVKRGGYAVLPTHPEMVKLMEQDSGLEVEKPVIPLSQFPAFTAGDRLNSIWIFQFAKDLAEMEKMENSGGKKKKGKKKGK